MQAYRPGETISGALEFTLTEPKKYKCIKVHFFGRAHVHWKWGKTTYRGQEKYIDDVIFLWRPQQNEPIGPGSFSFKFQFVIPPHVPSSFSHVNTGLFNDGQGSISYEIEGIGVTGLLRFDDRTAAEIVIQRATSIRGETQAPVRQVKRGQVGCLCCAAGNVEFIAKVPRTGYCVADKIPLTVDIENSSSKEIRMEAKIVRRIAFYVYQHECTNTDTVAKVLSDPISPRDTITWSPDDLVVPRVPPTLEGCRIIEVVYKLSVVAIMPNSLDLVCDIPLFVGTISYSNSLDQVILERVLIPLLRQRLAAGQSPQSRPTNSQSAVSHRGTHATPAPQETASNDDDYPYNSKETDALL